LTLESFVFLAPEINTGPAVWRPVTDRPADVVEVGLPFTADQARRAGVSLD
jgi:D-psicose/D-tagatose/L-ribulose 3-epimerase